MYCEGLWVTLAEMLQAEIKLLSDQRQKITCWIDVRYLFVFLYDQQLLFSFSRHANHHVSLEKYQDSYN